MSQKGSPPKSVESEQPPPPPPPPQAQNASSSSANGGNLYPDANSIVDAVECLQQRKMKPDVDKICIYIEKHWPETYRKDPKMVDVLVAECLSHGLIVSVNNQGAVSFRTPSKIGRMLRVTKILPFDGEVPDSVVHDVMRTIGEIEKTVPGSHMEDEPLGRGVQLDKLVKYLHQSLRLLNYTEEILETKVMPTALAQKFVDKIELDEVNEEREPLVSVRYTLTKEYRREYGLHFRAKHCISSSDEEEKAEVEVREKPKKKNKTPDKARKLYESRESPVGEESASRPVTRRRMNDSMMDVDDNEEDDVKNDSNEYGDMDVENEDAKNSDSKDTLNAPQRVSTRKKFKKSLGPDFVDTSEQLAYYLKESTAFVPKCSVCAGLFPKYKPNILGKKRPSATEPQFEPSEPDMIQCFKCESKVHVSCLNLNESVGLKYQWRCGSCGTCDRCKQTKRRDFCIICKTCKKSYHTLCTAIRRNSKDHSWDCESCYHNRLIDNASQSTSLLSSKSPRTTPIVSTTSSFSDSKNRTLLSRTATTSIAPKPLLTKVNSQPVHVIKNTSLLSRQPSSESPSNSLLMPVANNGQQNAPKVSTASNIILNNITEKQKTSASTSDNTSGRDSLLRTKFVTKPIGIKEESLENTVKKQALKRMDQNVKVNTEKHSTGLKYGPTLKEVLDPKSAPEIKLNFVAWVNCELKNYVKCNPSVLFALPININRWKSKDVHTFMNALGFSRTAQLLFDNNVDGKSLLLLRREDILERLGLKMGTALKLYAFLLRLRSEITAD